MGTYRDVGNLGTLLDQSVSASVNSSSLQVRHGTGLYVRIEVSNASSFDADFIIQTSIQDDPGASDWDDLTESDTNITADGNTVIEVKDVFSTNVRVKVTRNAGSADVVVYGRCKEERG